MNYSNKMNYKFAIVDQNNIKDINAELYQYVLERTIEQTKNLSYSVSTYDNIDDAVEDSEGIVIIQTVGNFIHDKNFTTLIDDYVKENPDFFLLAFTLDWMPEKGEGWIELHSQMLVINTRVWKQLGSPKYGTWTRELKTVPKYIRSEENFHDKYTPYWIQGTEGEEERIVIHPGWGYLQAALAKGMKIDNFTADMRDCRLYIYPEHMSDELWYSITNKNIDKIDNFNQKKFIKELK